MKILNFPPPFERPIKFYGLLNYPLNKKLIVYCLFSRSSAYLFSTNTLHKLLGTDFHGFFDVDLSKKYLTSHPS